MNHDLPLVSIVMATYNRANTIKRAVDSVLNQTYKNIELIIIDDGSTDNTLEIISRYSDHSIRVYKHERNKGVTAAKNSGLRQIKGEWFTILDSDDEILPEAIEKMMSIPLFYDRSVTAVTCNCLDTTKKIFSGKGLTKSQYIDVDTLMTICKGEFWGITKTSLLGDDQFNEGLPGFESVLWFKIDDRANRYYYHEALRIYHTEGDDRITKSRYNYNKEVNLYKNLIQEKYFLNKIKKYESEEFNYFCKMGVMVMRVADRKDLALKYYELINPTKKGFIIKLVYLYKPIAVLIKNLKIAKMSLKLYLLRLKN